MRQFLLAVLLVAALMNCGCTTKVTVENYEKVKVGMTLEDVEKILGPHTKSYQGIKTWRDGNTRSISVVLDDRGLVAEKHREGL
jgi:hypothetical protein